MECHLSLYCAEMSLQCFIWSGDKVSIWADLVSKPGLSVIKQYPYKQLAIYCLGGSIQNGYLPAYSGPCPT